MQEVKVAKYHPLGNNASKYRAVMDLVYCLWTPDECTLATSCATVGGDERAGALRLFANIDQRSIQARYYLGRADNSILTLQKMRKLKKGKKAHWLGSADDILKDKKGMERTLQLDTRMDVVV